MYCSSHPIHLKSSENVNKKGLILAHATCPLQVGRQFYSMTRMMEALPSCGCIGSLAIAAGKEKQENLR